MILYAVLMFSAAALILTVALAVYRGKTNLIHDYHQSRVRDKRAYGKAFGKALTVVALAPLLSGAISLAGASEGIAAAAVIVLTAGLGIGIACIYAVQKEYNQGLF